MARIEEVCRWALERGGLAVILNIHHYEEMATDPRGHQARFLSLWQQIAAHFQGAPANLFSELLNEPNGACITLISSEIAARAIAVIRPAIPAPAHAAPGCSFDHRVSLL
jgi:endoglucanase